MPVLRGVLVVIGLFTAIIADSVQAQTTTQSDFLYVCNQEGASISVVDVGTLEVVKTIRLEELGFSANAKPHHVAVEPDGSAWYVTLIGENVVLKFNRANEVIGRATFETPGLLALSPSENKLYVGRSMTAVNPPHRIGVIERATMELEEIDVVFPRPHLLDIRPSGDFLYSASLAQNQLAAVEAATEEVELITLEGPSHALAHSALSPDGQTLVVTPHMPHLMVFDLSQPAQPKLTATIDVGEMPWHPVYSRDGNTVYVPNQASNNLSVVDMRSRSVTSTVKHEAFAEPYGSAISRDGRYVFISNSNTKGAWAAPGTTAVERAGNVVVIDTRTNDVAKVIAVGRGPTGIGTQR